MQRYKPNKQNIVSFMKTVYSTTLNSMLSDTVHCFVKILTLLQTRHSLLINCQSQTIIPLQRVTNYGSKGKYDSLHGGQYSTMTMKVMWSSF